MPVGAITIITIINLIIFANEDAAALAHDKRSISMTDIDWNSIEMLLAIFNSFIFCWFSPSFCSIWTGAFYHPESINSTEKLGKFKLDYNPRSGRCLIRFWFQSESGEDERYRDYVIHAFNRKVGREWGIRVDKGWAIEHSMTKPCRCRWRKAFQDKLNGINSLKKQDWSLD